MRQQIKGLRSKQMLPSTSCPAASTAGLTNSSQTMPWSHGSLLLAYSEKLAVIPACLIFWSKSCGTSAPHSKAGQPTFLPLPCELMWLPEQPPHTTFPAAWAQNILLSILSTYHLGHREKNEQLLHLRTGPVKPALT